MHEEWIVLGKASAIDPGQYQSFETEHGFIIVVNFEDEFYALDDICTHDGGALSGGWFEEGQLICPRHGAHFCVKTGEALTPPAYEPVNTYPVKIEAGIIKIKIA
jgi:3-phenylpropionate/trans-cinnamate dioxygenase ferredoxin subunit